MRQAKCNVCNQTATVSATEVMTAHERAGRRCPGTGGAPGAPVEPGATIRRTASTPYLREPRVHNPRRSQVPRQATTKSRVRVPAPKSKQTIAREQALESRKQAAAESQRMYEVEMAARKQADLDRGIRPKRKAEVDPKKRRWVQVVVGGGSPGLGKR